MTTFFVWRKNLMLSQIIYGHYHLIIDITVGNDNFKFLHYKDDMTKNHPLYKFSEVRQIIVLLELLVSTLLIQILSINL